MIESCSVERMLIGFMFLGGLTFLVLYIESYWTDNSDRTLVLTNLNSSKTECWLLENFKVLEDCHPCNDFEITSKTNEACEETKYKELVECEKSGRFYKSCSRVTWLEEGKFWKFEFFVFVLCVLSTSTVFLRQRILNRRMMLRIQKQLANCP